MNRILLFLALVATAGLAAFLILASPASAAAAYVQLEPGDTVVSTESTVPVESRTHAVLGHNVLWLQTEAPAVVGIRIQHGDGTTTDHVTATAGYRLDDVLDATAAITVAVADLDAAAHDLSLGLAEANDDLTLQQARLGALQIDVANATAQVAGQAQRLDQALAAANAARLAAENIHVPEPDLTPAVTAAEAATIAAQDAKSGTDRLLVFTIINASMTAALALATVGRMGALGVAGLRDCLGRLTGREATLQADDTPPADPEVALEEQIEANRALAAELLPGQAGPGDALGNATGVVPAAPNGGGSTTTRTHHTTARPATQGGPAIAEPSNDDPAPLTNAPEPPMEPETASEPAPESDVGPTQEAPPVPHAASPPTPATGGDDGEEPQDAAKPTPNPGEASGMSLHVSGGLQQTHPLN